MIERADMGTMEGDDPDETMPCDDGLPSTSTPAARSGEEDVDDLIHDDESSPTSSFRTLKRDLLSPNSTNGTWLSTMNRASSPISGCPPVDTDGGGVVGSGVRIVGGVGLAVVGTGLGLVVGGGVVGSGVRCGMTGGGVGSVVGKDVEGKGVGDDHQYSLIYQ